MDHGKQKVDDYLKLPDEELLLCMNVANDTPDSNLARAVLQHRLSKNIERLNDSTDRYSKFLVLLTMLLMFLGIYQTLMILIQPTGNDRYIWIGVFVIFFFGGGYFWWKALYKGEQQKKEATTKLE